VRQEILILGVDGGGTCCRARLCTLSGVTLGEASDGPANIRFGIQQSVTSILDVTQSCLRQAKLEPHTTSRIVACLALAGACEPQALAAAQAQSLPFRSATITSDAKAACIGAHGGRDGGIVVVGTGAIGWAELGGRSHRVGGWGLPVSDEGSGAWLGCEALRRTLWATDGRTPWTGLLSTLRDKFQSPDAIVRWSTAALPREFGSLAPVVVEHAARGDATAIELMRLAADHANRLAGRLLLLGADRLALFGGLAHTIEGYLPKETRSHLFVPLGDALAGALQMARAAAVRSAAA
jgi:glucosamine kinase